MNILRADRMHGVYRKTGVVQVCGCEETNALVAKWALEEAAQKERDEAWKRKFVNSVAVDNHSQDKQEVVS